MPTVAEVQLLEREVRELEKSIATTKGKLQQLKSEDGSWTIESLRERLVELEAERIELEGQYSSKCSEYARKWMEMRDGRF